MNRKYQKLSVAVAFCALLAPADGPALGQQLKPRPQETIGATHGQIAGAIAGIAGAGIGIGIGIAFAVKHNHTLTGCAHSGPDGMTLTSQSDKQTYALLGDVAGIKSGDRVRVSGKKAKEKTAGTHQFLVEKVSKDLGPCEAGSQVR